MTREENAARMRQVRAARKAGSPPKPHGRPINTSLALSPEDQQWLRDHWTDPRFSDRELAAHTSISVSTLYLYKARLNLPDRPERQRRRGTANRGGYSVGARRSDEARAARMVARCEAALAKHQGLPVKSRRCDTCKGMEATSQPHRHAA